MDFSQLREAYTDVRRACRNDWRSDAVSQAILDLAVTSLQFLAAECDQIALNSLVPGKNYISFLRNGVVTRPANRALFLLDPERIAKEWHSWMRNRPNIPDAGRIFYTVALAPCLARELFGRNNKKGPATFFECMIGHFFAKSLDTIGRTVLTSALTLIKLEARQQNGEALPGFAMVSVKRPYLQPTSA